MSCGSLTGFSSYVSSWSPCCLLTVETRKKAKKRNVKKGYNRRQLAEVDRARSTVRQKTSVDSLTCSEEEEGKKTNRRTFSFKKRSKELPQPKGIWADLVRLMPLVDVAYFRNRLRSLRRLDLMHKMKGNHTILHYAVDRQDAAAVDLILTKISDPHDQNLLMCTKNEFGLSPHEAALNITTNKVRGDILRLFADARARIEDDDDEVLEEDYDDNTKSS